MRLKTLVCWVVLGGAAWSPSLIADLAPLTIRQRAEWLQRVEIARRSAAAAAATTRNANVSALVSFQVEPVLQQDAFLTASDRPITAEALARELRRIVLNGKDPQTLKSIFALLGNDSQRIQEILARPALTRRKIRSLYEGSPSFDPEAWAHFYRELANSEDALRAERGHNGLRLTDETGATRLDVPTRSFDEWWGEESGRWPSATVTNPAQPIDLDRLWMLREGLGASGTCLAPDDEWINGILDDFPQRKHFSAVWTGTEVLVWGGTPGTSRGARYDPLIDSWSVITDTGAPEPRSVHRAIWTGSEMIVFGGNCTDCALGGRYNPVSNSWSGLSEVNAPIGRIGHTAVWTGSEMIVWGGVGIPSFSYLADGGRYDVASDTWTTISTTFAPSPRAFHTAVFDGSSMIVWGGFVSNEATTGDGARYDLEQDRWIRMPPQGAPAPRGAHAAVWTGTEMFVWGGAFSNPTNSYLVSGARYDPQTNAWGPATNLTGAPVAGEDPKAVWTGSEVLIWGFTGSGSIFGQGARYNPETDSWVGLPSTGHPSYPNENAAVWTGSEFLAIETTATSVYEPTTDQWTPARLATGLEARQGHSAVWTGTHVLLWGGSSAGSPAGPVFDDGATYDPLLDDWAPLNSSGAPAARWDHSAVWTGTEMLIWGGDDKSQHLVTGAAFNPVTDDWRPLSTSGVPPGRSGAAAVWTGAEMIVWGGLDRSAAYFVLADGGRYDPIADSWDVVSSLGQPTPRRLHTAVWTGTEMIVWGGENEAGEAASPTPGGARYVPGATAWTPVAMTDSPSPRSRHSAVWTGTEMIVWGGGALGSGSTSTGSRYDPQSDSWSAMTQFDAPAPRGSHAAVWTGTEMLMWGGGVGGGGRYSPGVDSWVATNDSDAPPGRLGPAAVWTGSGMFVWGGSPIQATGGIYYAATDDDADGVANYCDCAPSDPSVNSGPAETSGLRWGAPTTLTWNPVQGAIYDLIRGTDDSLPLDGASVTACIASGIATPEMSIVEQPAPDELWLYLVRATNPCGVSGYGADSSGSARLSTACAP